MNITIHVTREDYWQLNKYVLWKKYKGTVYSFLLCTPILMFIIFFIMKLPTIFSIVAAIVLGTLVNVFSYNSLKNRAKKVLSDKPGILGSHIMDNILCHVIPKRDFTSQDEASQFIIMAQAFFESKRKI